MNDVAQWLEQLGLRQYAELFEKHAITAEVLPDLNEGHLKEIGVTMGHRLQIMKAVAALDRTGSHDLLASAASTEAERRQLTVMFCDLVGSTELSEQFDPEQLRDLILAYQDACKLAIERFDGYIAKYMGDGVLAYFGFPQAHEDDPERAVRAGLQVLKAMDSINANVAHKMGIKIAVRVGASTGPVVVGDLVGEGSSQESAVVGETPNIAARLQGLAEPNTVLVSAETFRMTAGHFQYLRLGEKQLKGISRLVSVYQAEGPSSVHSRFEAIHGRKLTPLVGRKAELADALTRWKQAVNGVGHLILVSGEPGVGKSRLCETVVAHIANHPHALLRYQCSPHDSNSAFYPIIEHLQRAAGLTCNTDAQFNLHKLRMLLQRSQESVTDDLRLIATLLSIPLEPLYEPLDGDSQELKERMLQALTRYVQSIAATNPVLVLFEDLHWVDDSTMELLHRLVEATSKLPMLVLATSRSELQTPWTDLRHATLIHLDRISAHDSRLLLDSVAGVDSLGEDIASDILAKTEGIPLFIEETTRAVVESKALSDGASTFKVPATLQDSLMARLDRLTAGKQVVQTAAAIGIEFEEELLTKVCGLTKWKLDKALHELADRGLTFTSRESVNRVHVFKHALLQETAYSTVLLANRKPLHRRIAEVLEGHAPGQLARLAHHWEHADNLEKALVYRLEAARREARGYAIPEALSHYWAAFELLGRLPEPEESSLRGVDIVIEAVRIKSLAVMRLEPDISKLVVARLNQAIPIALSQKRFGAAALLEIFKSEETQDESLVNQALSHASASGDKAVQADVEFFSGIFLGIRGRYEDSRPHTNRAIELYGELDDGVMYCTALAGSGRCFSARAGRIDESVSYAVRARKVAHATENPAILSWIAMEAEPYMYKGLWQCVLDHVRMYLPFAMDGKNWFVVLCSSSWATIAAIKLGQFDYARHFIDEAFAGVGTRLAEFPFPLAYFYQVQAELELNSGNTETALKIVCKSLEIGKRGGFLLEQGAAHRTLGMVYAARGNAHGADTAFRRSLEILGEIQSRPEVAQSLLAYGRFVIDTDKDEGKSLLVRSLELFQEIDATGWVDETQLALRIG